MGSEAGNIRMGLSKVLCAALSSINDVRLIRKLVVSYNVPPVILHCLQILDGAQCFPAMLSVTAVP